MWRLSNRHKSKMKGGKWQQFTWPTFFVIKNVFLAFICFVSHPYDMTYTTSSTTKVLTVTENDHKRKSQKQTPILDCFPTIWWRYFHAKKRVHVFFPKQKPLQVSHELNILKINHSITAASVVMIPLSIVVYVREGTYFSVMIS